MEISALEKPIRPPPTAPASRRVTIRSFGGRIVSVPDIDFIGWHAMSPNGRFTLMTQDRATINGTDRGCRYVLIDEGRVVLDRPMARPHDGKVADDGTFILNDWGDSGALSGTSTRSRGTDAAS